MTVQACFLTVAMAFFLAPASCWCQDAASPDLLGTASETDATEETVATAPSDWHATLDDAITQAAESNKPIFVIVGAPWCVYCKKLEKELQGDQTTELARTWVLAKIDADEQVSDARELRANGLPSLRLLSTDGVVAYSHDGYMDGTALRTWLNESYDAVKNNVPQMLEIDPADFSDEQVGELVGFLATRDVTVRRIIIERLSKIPNRCVIQTIELLNSKRLADQLSAIQLLRRWKAPVEELDPWIPGSIDEQTIETLRQWSNLTYPEATIET